MYKLGDTLYGYELTVEDIDFLNSEKRLNTVYKTALLGALSSIVFNDDYSTVKDIIKTEKYIKLPDIAVAMSTSNESVKSHLEKLTLNRHLRVLDKESLMLCGIKRLELNEGLKVIAEYALALNVLHKLVIPSTLEKLGCNSLKNTFRGVSELTVKTTKISFLDIIKALNIQTSCVKLILKLPPELKKEAEQVESQELLLNISCDVEIADIQ